MMHNRYKKILLIVGIMMIVFGSVCSAQNIQWVYSSDINRYSVDIDPGNVHFMENNTQCDFVSVIENPENHIVMIAKFCVDRSTNRYRLIKSTAVFNDGSRVDEDLGEIKVYTDDSPMAKMTNYIFDNVRH